MEPFYQGALDSLCGVYSIINAVKKVTKNIDSEDLFTEIIKHLDNKNNLSEIMLNGINRQILSGIFNEVVGGKVKINSPFWSKPNTSLDVFWNGMTNFLDENEKHAILIGIGGRKWDHWSVIKSISPNQIRFFDSYELKQLNRSSCTTKKWTVSTVTKNDGKID